MVLIVAIFLFLICETTLSFVFYFTGFLLILTLVNLWYLSKPRQYVEPVWTNRETLVTRQERDNNIRRPKVTLASQEDKEVRYTNISGPEDNSILRLATPAPVKYNRLLVTDE